MNLTKTLFAATMIFSLVTAAVGQEPEKRESKQLDRVVNGTAKQLMTGFRAANLTEDQKTRATEIVRTHAEKLMQARKAVEGLLTAEQKGARKEALAAARNEGLKGKKMTDAGFAAMKLTDEERETFAAAQKKVADVMNEIRKQITATLSESQQAALKTKGGKGKGKGKPDRDGQLQEVSLKLPGMTCPVCAASVRAALTEVAGISAIETNPEDNTCTFKATAEVNVEQTLNQIAEHGNRHIQGWSRTNGG